jgi:protoporphyrinogen oxidase
MIVLRKDAFADSWFYIQSKDYKIARIGNYGAFSPEMLADPNTSAIGIEFYCFAGDAFWQKSDDEVINLALNEMIAMNFMTKEEFGGAFVVRHEDAYPTYYLGYREGFAKLREYLERFSNLRLIGRAGMYKYKDQDHAMYTGMLTVRNLFGEHHDVWQLGEEKEFFEEKVTNGPRDH